MKKIRFTKKGIYVYFTRWIIFSHDFKYNEVRQVINRQVQKGSPFYLLIHNFWLVKFYVRVYFMQETEPVELYMEGSKK